MNRIITQKAVFRYPGSKNKAASEIISYFPEHNLYCDVFGGSAAILIRKEKTRVEVYNDIRSDLVNLFQVLTYNFDDFEKKTQFMVNSREWFYNIKKGEIPNINKIDKSNFAEEMADIIIRVLDCTIGLEIDITTEINNKLEKNAKRGYKHGGKKL